LHILFFTGQFPYPNDLSRCIFASHLARAVAREVDVSVVCPVPKTPPVVGRYLPRFSKTAEVPEQAIVHDQLVHFPRFLNVPKMPRHWVSRSMASGVRSRIEAIHRQKPIDLIHCRWLFPDGVAAVELGQSLNVPVVLTAMGCDANEYIDNPQMGPLIKASLRSANALTGVSKPLQSLLALHSADSGKCFYTPNGVDLEGFQTLSLTREQARQQLGWPQTSHDILFVGRFAHEKNIGLLLNSFALLKQDSAFSQTRLWLAGHGDQLTTLKQLAERLQLTDCHFLGEVAHKELATYFKAASVVALSSDREGMPNAVIEALALGTPVVATSVGAIPDLIDASNGVISTPGDVPAFSHSLALALNRRWDHSTIAQSMTRTWRDAAQSYLEAYNYALSRVGAG
jgi:teichuronic acid biosynthesis glycosyltransferase TuaC